MDKRKEARLKILESFNPDENGLSHHGIFGLPFAAEESEIILLPVPWEVTVSYSAGTAQAPQAILNASQQIDLYDPVMKESWKRGIAMEEIIPYWEQQNEVYRKEAAKYIDSLFAGEEIDGQVVEKIDEACDQLRDWVKTKTSAILDEGKLVGIIGGDHSTPLGYIQALAERHEDFGILQIDAHADLRKAYEGFTYSHASIMYNTLHIPQVSTLTQVGIRDISNEEMDFIRDKSHRINLFTDADLRRTMFTGKSFAEIVEEMIDTLPEKVYVSFDIDGLDPALCPNTGTPVPGGLSFNEATYILEQIPKSGRKVIGFDLCEVSPGENEWDANVGMRILWRLISILPSV